VLGSAAGAPVSLVAHKYSVGNLALWTGRRRCEKQAEREPMEVKKAQVRSEIAAEPSGAPCGQSSRVPLPPCPGARGAPPPDRKPESPLLGERVADGWGQGQGPAIARSLSCATNVGSAKASPLMETLAIVFRARGERMTRRPHFSGYSNSSWGPGTVPEEPRAVVLGEDRRWYRYGISSGPTIL
jgi:hypothetical protein